MLNGKTTQGFSKFTVDALYNFASLGLLVVCGLLVNFIIARQYGAAALGVFNQTYSIYIVVTQIASLGVQMSVIKHVAQLSSTDSPLDGVITSALVITALSTTIFSAALFFLREPMANLLDSQDIATSLTFVIPGLWCLSLNKIFFSVLNALREMKAYALLSALRYTVMLISLLCLSFLNISGNRISVIFSTAEILLLFPCLFMCLKKFSFSFHRLAEWGKIHLVFGLKSIPGGMISILNTRVDILMLGYFLPDRQVGQYSLAAMIVEGILQLPFVFRRNLDPIITRLYVLKDHDSLQKMIGKITGTTFIGMLLIGALAALLMPIAVKVLIGGDSFAESYRLFLILMAGTIIVGTYLPASGILVQTGFPGYQTIFFLLCFITNVILNGGMIIVWGSVGAALATSISFGLSVLYLKWFSSKFASIRL